MVMKNRNVADHISKLQDYSWKETAIILCDEEQRGCNTTAQSSTVYKFSLMIKSLQGLQKWPISKKRTLWTRLIRKKHEQIKSKIIREVEILAYFSLADFKYYFQHI